MLNYNLLHIMARYTDWPEDLLAKGALMMEPNVRPGCSMSYAALRVMHHGKDCAIGHMLDGGNGFAEDHFGRELSHLEQVQFDLGVQQERRDLRANQVWARDLNQALADRKRGRCDG